MPSTSLYEVYCLYTPESAPQDMPPEQRQLKVFGVADLHSAHVAANYLNQRSSLMGTQDTRLAEMREWEIGCRPLANRGNIVPMLRAGDLLPHALQWLSMTASQRERAHAS